MARLRAAAHLGVDLRIGVASTAALAATASAQAPMPGGLVVVEPEQAHQWLEPLPVGALYGLGERQASDLRHYGVHCAGQLAGLSLHTVQRILGARAGRLAWERARGIDPRPVTPRALPASLSRRHRFSRQTLDGAEVRATLLDTVVRLGTELRRRGQITQVLTLTLEFASGSPLARTRRLPQACAHEDDLRTTAYRIMDSAALQRALLTGLPLRADDLLSADQAAGQLSLDGERETRLAAQDAVDCARARFGPQVMVGPASLLGKAS
ncbi:hypothetical protein ACIRVK_42950 [Streptomyces sp. NPDC101152]|uniref:DNA polymerase Y family protein n=1 Tax=Streptomyces sp. NPDC101152 TaxID=3366116 RepID=UPI00382F6A9F